jgi:hypothetical protein
MRQRRKEGRKEKREKKESRKERITLVRNAMTDKNYFTITAIKIHLFPLHTKMQTSDLMELEREISLATVISIKTPVLLVQMACLQVNVP